MTGQQLYDLLSQHLGEPYILGSLVPKDDANYKGPWDCAELTSWGVYQLTKQLYGCANNSGNPHTADSYTGYYARDVVKIGKLISINAAFKTPGAFLLRVSANGIVGHIVCSNGYGKTIEAHGHKDGVIHSVINGRRWDYGLIIPWISYTPNDSIEDIDVLNRPPAEVIYRFKNPMMRGENVRRIQLALGMDNVDGIFGRQTFNAVRGYQSKKGLTPDGEVGPLTLKALGIKLDL